MGKWTAADIPPQDGRRVVVTGANSGIGLVAASELARAGARVVLACRSVERGRAAVKAVREHAPGAEVTLEQLDLADLASVRAFADRRTEALDLLVNNAGVMALPRTLTADGFEMQIGTNHLGHFALTGLLLERLLAGDGPRVVTVASGAHRFGKIDFDDLHGEHGYNRWRAYGQSKLANILFFTELQRRADAAGVGLLSVGAHPGYAATHLQLQSGDARGGVLGHVDALAARVANLVFAQSDDAGARPTLYAATQELPGGAYIGPDGPGEMRGHPTTVGMSGRAQDADTARRLWDVSGELTGVDYAALAVAA